MLWLITITEVNWIKQHVLAQLKLDSKAFDISRNHKEGPRVWRKIVWCDEHSKHDFWEPRGVSRGLCGTELLFLTSPNRGLTAHLQKKKNKTQTGQIQIPSFKTHPSFVCFLSHFTLVSFLAELIKLLPWGKRCSLPIFAICQTINRLCEKKKRW